MNAALGFLEREGGHDKLRHLVKDVLRREDDEVFQLGEVAEVSQQPDTVVEEPQGVVQLFSRLNATLLGSLQGRHTQTQSRNLDHNT